METFIVSFLIFSASVLLLLLGQWLRRAPMPTGCTPDNGECCRIRPTGRGHDAGPFVARVESLAKVD